MSVKLLKIIIFATLIYSLPSFGANNAPIKTPSIKQAKTILSKENSACKKGVSKKINQSGYLSESDRAKLMDDCNKFQDYRLNIDKSEGAYMLTVGSFSCRTREDYVAAYNRVIARGGQYSTAVLNKFKSCRTIKTPTLVAVRGQKDPSDPIVSIVYHSRLSVYFLHTGWIHKAELMPYKKLMSRQVK